MNHAVAIGVLCLLCQGCLLSAKEAECQVDWDSDRCLRQSGCGFCDLHGDEERGLCISGSSFGPDDPSGCHLSLWRFDDYYAPPAALGCRYHSRWDCDSSSLSLRCKWCDNANVCVDDDAACPTGGDISCQAASCTSCGRLDGCVWCSDTFSPFCAYACESSEDTDFTCSLE